jgi:lysophospholipid acyltransferase (LPLAT)-like uncharacterized protein
VKDAAKRFLHGPVTGAAIAAGHRLLAGLGRTWRVRHVGGERLTRARFGPGRGPVLYAFTHGVLLPLTFTHRDRGVRVLVSQSRDGEIIARILERLGFDTVRGSSTRGGDRAALQLAATGREGHDLAVTPDGPRGPRGSVAPGVAVVAARAATPIVPLGVASRPAWNARSWDRFLVPPPFARVWVVYGEPIEVPAGAAADPGPVLERVRAALVAAEAEAARCAAGEPPVSAVRMPA